MAEAKREMQPSRPTWAETDLAALAHNTRRLKGTVGEGVQMMVMVKANAYGHGAVEVARTVLANGAQMLGVAFLGEALALCQAGIEAPILLLGYCPSAEAPQIVAEGLRATVYSWQVAQALSQAATRAGKMARVHIKVDTGMGRLGLPPQQAAEFIKKAARLPGLIIEGVFTHLAVADSPNARGIDGWGRRYTHAQLAAFRALLEGLERERIHIPLAHAANSAAILAYPEAHFNLVRPGTAIYGLDPSPDVPCPADFRPVLSFKTTVSQVKELPAGSYVSYGCTHRSGRRARLAVIPVGYADGFRRAPRNWGQVLVGGTRAPVVGRVCMDQSMVEVSHIPEVRQGDVVVLIGLQGKERISAEEVAERLGTNNYEVASGISSRVPRLFHHSELQE